MIHIWTADIYEGDMWSSQWFSNLSNWNKEAWKKSGLQRDSNPWPPRYRCDALPTELWSHTLGARSIVSSYFPVKGVKWCNVYEMIHIWTADIYEGDMWSSQWISNLSNWNKEAWKKSGLQRDSNPWPPRYRCDALPTELWSHTLGARSSVSSYFPVKGVKWCNVYEMIHIWTADIYEYIWIISYTLHHFTPFTGKYELTIDLAPNVWLHSSVGRASHRYRGGHGFESRWSPDFFQASLFQLLKLEIHCEDHISPSYISAVHIWIISYTLHHFTPFTGKYELTIDLAPNVWLHSSVGRASHRYRGGHGFESRWSPDFFQASLFQLLKLEIHCEDHISPSSDSVASHFQTPPGSSKILRCASNFRLSSRCLEKCFFVIWYTPGILRQE